MKQVDLYNKLRPFVPLQNRDEICPKPTAAIVRSVKDERKEPSTKKKQSKTAASTSASGSRPPSAKRVRESMESESVGEQEEEE